MDKEILKPNTSTRYILQGLETDTSKNLLCKVRYYLRGFRPIIKNFKYRLIKILSSSFRKLSNKTLYSLRLTLKYLKSLCQTTYPYLMVRSIFVSISLMLFLFSPLFCLADRVWIDKPRSVHFFFGYSLQEWQFAMPWLVILFILLLLLVYLFKLANSDKNYDAFGRHRK